MDLYVWTDDCMRWTGTWRVSFSIRWNVDRFKSSRRRNKCKSWTFHAYIACKREFRAGRCIRTAYRSSYYKHNPSLYYVLRLLFWNIIKWYKKITENIATIEYVYPPPPKGQPYVIEIYPQHLYHSGRRWGETSHPTMSLCPLPPALVSIINSI